MPLPFILGAAAVVAGLTGVRSGINGAVKIKDAKDTMKSAKRIHEKSIKKFEDSNKITIESMDTLGKKELEILNSFKDFSDIMEIIQNKPEFKNLNIKESNLPEYNPEEIKKVSVGAGVVLGGLGGAAAGTAGGFAAAGATTSAVMALGTASTGTAISSLSGAAATNAALAALGGGAIEAGGGGMLLGSTILSASTLGVGLLVTGVVFNISGNKLSDDADEAWREAKKQEEKSNEICMFLDELKETANIYCELLNCVNYEYIKHLEDFKRIVYNENRTNFKYYSYEEKIKLKNLVLLVSLLNNMCKVNLVKKTESDKEVNKVNSIDIRNNMLKAKKVLGQVA